jgi:UDP-2,3-diacylglucosamine pyrophosphatase LpxH
MTAPIFVISDLHIGSGGTRDSFDQYDRSSCFNRFLNYVEKENGELIILGDFIDLWKFNLKKVIKARIDLLDRLFEMKVCCIPGNHDQAFTAYMNSNSAPHPLFTKVTKPFVRLIGGSKFSFFHGHELDIYNRNLTPRIGRVLGVSSSWVEYIKGYPVFSSENIEEALLKIEEKLFVFCFSVMSQLNKFLNISEIFENIQVLPRQKRIEKQILKHE